MAPSTGRGVRRRLGAADLAAYRWCRAAAPGEGSLAHVKRFSKLGEHGTLWYGVGVCGALVDRRRSRRWLAATATVAVAYGTSTSIKLAVGRRRPAVPDLPHLMQTPTGLSFPSSHSTSSFAAARAFSGLLPAGPLYVAATAMACSRLILGVHYPSDILAGMALGTVMGASAR